MSLCNFGIREYAPVIVEVGAGKGFSDPIFIQRDSWIVVDKIEGSGWLRVTLAPGGLHPHPNIDEDIARLTDRARLELYGKSGPKGGHVASCDTMVLRSNWSNDDFSGSVRCLNSPGGCL